jgi:ABC-type glycerol-3-phosphate transport system substrate-binding protein
MKRSIAIKSVLLILGLALILAGCSKKESTGASGGAASSAATGNADGSLSYKGTITFYAQSYNPVDPTAANPNPPTAFKQVARDWEALNPGITIEFITDLGQGQSYEAWLSTKMAGGQAPDIFWSQYYQLNAGEVPRGSFIPMTEYLQRPNKYIPGNTKWLDTFPEGLVKQFQASDGNINLIDADYVATLVIYNVEMFEKAGINFDIHTWSDYTKACQMLKAVGITPWIGNLSSSGVDYVSSWLSRLMYSNLYNNDFTNLTVIGGRDAVSLTPEEVALGVKNGYFTSKDPRWLSWWPLLKDHVDNYMPRDVVSAASVDTLNAFVNQQVAMYWDGSWADNNLRAANVSFKYSSFPFPYPDKASLPLATDFDSSGAVGGPSAGWQYAISSPRANNAMNDAKLEAVVDWLMFTTTPANNELIANDNGAFVPIIKGSKPLEANAGVASILESQAQYIVITTQLGTDVYEGYFRELQSYLQGSQSLERAGANLDLIMESAADRVISESSIDVSQYLKK